MRNRIRSHVIGGGIAAFLVAGAAFAMGGESVAVEDVQAAADFSKAKQAIKAERWDEAVELLQRAAARQERSADIYNYLGYAERHRGNFDAAFAHYRRALELDPKHRGAHEYVGEAYLLTGNLAKAEEHLAVLDKLCFLPCAEYRELRDKIAAYKQQRR